MYIYIYNYIYMYFFDTTMYPPQIPQIFKLQGHLSRVKLLRCTFITLPSALNSGATLQCDPADPWDGLTVKPPGSTEVHTLRWYTT